MLLLVYCWKWKGDT